MNILTSIKAQAGTLRSNFTEVYTYCLISFGLPLVALVYLDWRAALSVFVVTQIAIGVFALRSEGTKN